MKVDPQWDAELSKRPHQGRPDFQPIVILIREHPTEHVDANDLKAAVEQEQ